MYKTAHKCPLVIHFKMICDLSWEGCDILFVFGWILYGSLFAWIQFFHHWTQLVICSALNDKENDNEEMPCLSPTHNSSGIIYNIIGCRLSFQLQTPIKPQFTISLTVTEYSLSVKYSHWLMHKLQRLEYSPNILLYHSYNTVWYRDEKNDVMMWHHIMWCSILQHYAVYYGMKCIWWCGV